MRVFDCFLYYDEPPLLLTLRFRELAPVVDHFVVVEGNTTFSGVSKPARFPRSFQAHYPITHHLAELPPPVPDRWAVERAQRDAIATALEPLARPGDLILISDGDEIPKAPAEGVHVQSLYYYRLNVLMRPLWWRGTVGIEYAALRQTTPEEVRRSRFTRQPRIRPGGWHFSYLGDAAWIERKLRSFSEVGFDTPENLAVLEARMARNESPWGDGRVGTVVPVDETFPRTLQEHPEQFSELLALGGAR